MREIYNTEFIENYVFNNAKTKQGKKSAVRKEINQLKELLKDEQSAYSKSGYLFGEKIGLTQINRTKQNIKNLEIVYKGL